MSDAFEQFLGGILHRIFDKSPELRVIVAEDQMQAARPRKGQKPSVCHWMLLVEGHCIVIGATNHVAKREVAQGLATWDEYGSGSSGDKK